MTSIFSDNSCTFFVFFLPLLFFGTGIRFVYSKIIWFAEGFYYKWLFYKWAFKFVSLIYLNCSRWLTSAVWIVSLFYCDFGINSLIMMIPNKVKIIIMRADSIPKIMLCFSFKFSTSLLKSLDFSITEERSSLALYYEHILLTSHRRQSAMKH